MEIQTVEIGNPNGVIDTQTTSTGNPDSEYWKYKHYLNGESWQSKSSTCHHLENPMYWGLSKYFHRSWLTLSWWALIPTRQYDLLISSVPPRTLYCWNRNHSKHEHWYFRGLPKVNQVCLPPNRCGILFRPFWRYKNPSKPLKIASPDQDWSINMSAFFVSVCDPFKSHTTERVHEKHNKCTNLLLSKFHQDRTNMIWNSTSGFWKADTWNRNAEWDSLTFD